MNDETGSMKEKRRSNDEGRNVARERKGEAKRDIMG